MHRWVIVPFLVFLVGCAENSQRPHPQALSDALAFTIRDLDNAADLAKGKDAPWEQCMRTLSATVRERKTELDGVLQEQDKAMGDRRFGVASVVMLAHLQYATGGVPEEVRQQCAPVALDILMFLARIGAIAAPGGAALDFVLR